MSHKSRLRVLLRRRAQSEAVQAGLQLFHLFTQESLNIQQPVCAKPSGAFHAPALKVRQLLGCELFTGFTL